eukprot:Opistho-2@53110
MFTVSSSVALTFSTIRHVSSSFFPLGIKVTSKPKWPTSLLNSRFVISERMLLDASTLSSDHLTSSPSFAKTCAKKSDVSISCLNPFSGRLRPRRSCALANWPLPIADAVERSSARAYAAMTSARRRTRFFPEHPMILRHSRCVASIVPPPTVPIMSDGIVMETWIPPGTSSAHSCAREDSCTHAMSCPVAAKMAATVFETLMLNPIMPMRMALCCIELSVRIRDFSSIFSTDFSTASDKNASASAVTPRTSWKLSELTFLSPLALPSTRYSTISMSDTSSRTRCTIHLMARHVVVVVMFCPAASPVS